MRTVPVVSTVKLNADKGFYPFSLARTLKFRHAAIGFVIG
jgi:hypothetical protein